MSEVPYDIAQQMFRYLRNELSEKEEQDFLVAIRDNPRYMHVLESYRNGRQVQAELDFIQNLDIDEAWEKVNPNPQIPVSRRPTWWAIAASLVFLLLSGFWVWRYQQPDVHQSIIASQDILPATDKAQLILSDGRSIALQQDIQEQLTEADGTSIIREGGLLTYHSDLPSKDEPLIYNTLRVPKAGTFRLVLPDGSTVWLNANSELRFPVHFSNQERRIFLKGEAYFEVAKEAHRPFKVQVEGTEVEVLGTHFNVRAYGPQVATTLLEGSVKVEHAQQSVLLVPGQQANSLAHNIQVLPADITKAVAWKDHIFYFKQDRITDIMEEISRWYDVEVVYDGALHDQRYTGSIHRNAKLSEVLDLISFTSAVEFKISGRRVIMKF